MNQSNFLQTIQERLKSDTLQNLKQKFTDTVKSPQLKEAVKTALPITKVPEMASYLGQTIQGETPLMKKMHTYQGEPPEWTPATGAVVTALSPLETITDLIIRKDGGGIGGAISRGGDIPGALMSRGMSMDTAMTLGMGLAIMMPGAGELSSMGRRSKIPTTDLTGVDPILNTKRKVPVTDIFGKKAVIPEGEPLAPFKLKGGKVLLQDDDTYIVSKNQYENIKGQSVKAETKPFAPELEQTTETLKGKITVENPEWGKRGNDLIEEQSGVRVLKQYHVKENKSVYRIADKRGNTLLGGDYWDTQKGAQERANMEIKRGGFIGGTKYQDYQLDGGENYREILIQAPDNTVKILEEKGYIFKPSNADNWGSGKGIEVIRNGVSLGHWPDIDKATWAFNKNVGTFKTDHWPRDPNVISHLRLNDRVYGGGEPPKDAYPGIYNQKVTFIEETQSDWASQARKSGFLDEGVAIKNKIKRDTLKVEIEKLDKKIFDEKEARGEVSKVKMTRADHVVVGDRIENDDGGFIYVESINDSAESHIVFSDGEGINGSFYRDEGVPLVIKTRDATTFSELQKKLEPLNKKRTELVTERNNIPVESGVPHNPLLKNWQELTLKRALKEAVDSGSDYLSWTTGKQQQGRYNLSKQVDSITWKKPLKAGLKEVTIQPKDGNIIRLQIEGNVIKVGSDAVPSDWVGKNISDVIGKGIGDKIVAKSKGELTGKGLDIGGVWAFNLYDRQLPNTLKKLTGQDIEEIDIGVRKNRNIFTLSGEGVRVSSGDKLGSLLEPENIKVNQRIFERTEDFGTKGTKYIITENLGDGKFRAVSDNVFSLKKYSPSDRGFRKINNFKKGTRVGKITAYGETWYFDKDTAHDSWLSWHGDTFDIQGSKQQAIKITPAIRALVTGELLPLKQPSKLSPFAKSYADLLKNPDMIMEMANEKLGLDAFDK